MGGQPVAGPSLWHTDSDCPLLTFPRPCRAAAGGPPTPWRAATAKPPTPMPPPPAPRSPPTPTAPPPPAPGTACAPRCVGPACSSRKGPTPCLWMVLCSLLCVPCARSWGHFGPTQPLLLFVLLLSLQAPAQPPSGTKTVKVAQVSERVSVCLSCVWPGAQAPAALRGPCPHAHLACSSGSSAAGSEHPPPFLAAQPNPPARLWPARPQVSLTSHLEKLSMADWTEAAQNQFKGHLAGAVKGMNVGGGGGGGG